MEAKRVAEVVETGDDKIVIELSEVDASTLRALLGGIAGGKENESPLYIQLHERYDSLAPSDIRAVSSGVLKALKDVVGTGVNAEGDSY